MDTSERNLGDLLCTLNFDGITPNSAMPEPVDKTGLSQINNSAVESTNSGNVTEQTTVTETQSNLVVTASHNVREVVTITSPPTTPSQPKMQEYLAVTTSRDVREVVTITSPPTTTSQPKTTNTSNTNLAALSSFDSSPARKVVTISLDNTSPLSSLSIPVRALPANPDKNVAESPPNSGSPPTKSATDLHSDRIPPTEEVTSPNIDNSAIELTPRSVVTNLDSTEIETANLLLQLSTSQSNLDIAYDNADILPVDTERQEDFTRELREKEIALNEELDNAKNTEVNPIARNEELDNNTNAEVNPAVTNINSDADSDKTVNYTVDQSPTTEDLNLPKGKLTYQHYGITRKSPSNVQQWNYYCCYCETTCHSKKEINRHHKVEHTRVKCPDCVKTFPTPDVLARHRHVHNVNRFKCAVCKKICAFQSDLDLHMAKHTDDKVWYCQADGCDKDFKCKSDFTAHEVVHTGEFFICEFPKCTYKNRDPRLVKRHQRVHMREAKVQCKKCIRKFIFYQQMKRHMKQDHES